MSTFYVKGHVYMDGSRREGPPGDGTYARPFRTIAECVESGALSIWCRSRGDDTPVVTMLPLESSWPRL